MPQRPGSPLDVVALVTSAGGLSPLNQVLLPLILVIDQTATG